jgi:hypothetical protein
MSPHPEHLREMRLAAPPAKTCESCRHWGDQEDRDRDRPTRNCARIQGVGLTNIGDRAVIVRSCSSDPRVSTTAYFGCILHEPAESPR